MVYRISNIDTICIIIDIQKYDIVACNILNELEKEKQLSLTLQKDINNYKHIITINGLSFEILSNGCKGYSYILRNDGFEIKISKYKSKIENFAPLQVRISSEYLWSYGLIKSWNIIKDWITMTFGEIISNKVCRLDLATHCSGIDFITNYENVYKGHFKKYDKVFHTGTIINCITFGSRKGKNIYCRIYNKTLEIKETRKKSWFLEIWKNNNLDINNVWNLEFELKSEFLRSMNINSIEDCIKNINILWLYCTKEWLVKIDRINTRVSRCPTNSQWIELQNSFGNYNSNIFIKREKQVSLDAEMLVPNIVGNITSYSARNNKIDIKESFKKLYIASLKYLKDKNTTFSNEVSRKSKILYGKEVFNEQ